MAVIVWGVALVGCRSVVPIPSCADAETWNGTACVERPVCSDASCSGHGACTAGDDGLSCACESGYAGATCADCASGHRRDPSSGLCIRLDCATAFECGHSEPRPDVTYAPPRFRVVRLPTLPGGTQASTASDVNDAGQMTGTVLWRPTGGGPGRNFAFRFSESGGLEPLEVPGAAISGEAINEQGVVAGHGARAERIMETPFTHDGTTITWIGDSLPSSSAHVVSDINDAGVVVGECEVELTLKTCRYTPGSGWSFPAHGTAFGIARDGTIVGLSGETASSAWLLRDGEPLVDLGPPSVFHSVPYGISTNGRFIVAMHHAPTLTQSGIGLLIDRQAPKKFRVIEDDDGHLFRDLYVQPFDVNDQGFAVGNSLSAEGADTAWLFDPRRGETFALHELLVDLPEGWWVHDARAISNTGYIAATATDADANGAALLLAPIDWPASWSPPSPTTPAPLERRYEVAVVPDAEDERPGSRAVGFGADDEVLVLLSGWDAIYDEPTLQPAWHLDGEAPRFLESAMPPALPVRTSPSGRLVASSIVRDEFTDLLFYRAFASDGGTLTEQGVPDGLVHCFGYDVNDAGTVLAECLTPEGIGAFLRTPAGEWSSLFLGRPQALSETGLVVGARADDAIILDGANVTPLGLGAGATPHAISGNGRYVAGVHGHAFVFDREGAVFDWLPDGEGLSGGPGRVVPLAVDDRGVVVGKASAADGSLFAFAYDPRVGELVRLDRHLGTTSGLSLYEARDLRDDGAIVANGIDADGVTRGVVLRPISGD